MKTDEHITVISFNMALYNKAVELVDSRLGMKMVTGQFGADNSERTIRSNKRTNLNYFTHIDFLLAQSFCLRVRKCKLVSN